MGKRGKKKKQKKNRKIRKNYNKKEFSEVFCQTCLICQNQRDHKPDFCYKSLYKYEPKPFINKVFNNLIDFHAAYQAMGRSVRTLSIEQFQNIVCRTGICYDGDVFASAACDMVKDCYREFLVQLGVPNAAIVHELKATELIEFKNNKSSKRFISYRKKKKKRNKRYVCTPYATFFSNDNTDFQAEIRRILYGDNDKQQDTDQELSADTTGAANQHTEGGES